MFALHFGLYQLSAPMEPRPPADPPQKVWQQPWFWLVPFSLLAFGVVWLSEGRPVTLTGGPQGASLELGSAEPDLTTVLDSLLIERDDNVYRDWTLRQLRERYGLLTVEEMSDDEVNSLHAILKPDSSSGRLEPSILAQLVSEFRLYHADALSDQADHSASFLEWIDRKFEEGAVDDESEADRAARLQRVIDSDRFIAALRARADSGSVPFGSVERLYRGVNLGPPGDDAPRAPCVWVNRESRLRNRVVEVFNPETDRELVLLAVSGQFRARRDPLVQLNQDQYEFLSGVAGGPALSVLVEADPALDKVSDLSAGTARPRLSVLAARARCRG